MEEEEKEKETQKETQKEEAGTRQVPACLGGTLYQVRAGDTFWELARRFGTTVEAIQAANPGVDPRNLQVGQVICIPGVAPPTPVPPMPPVCPGGTIYIVQPGDTLYRIALRFGITVDALLLANPGIDPLRLMVGQAICVPLTPVPVPPRACALLLRPTLPTAPGAGGVAWIRTDATGQTQVLVAGTNLPSPAGLGAPSYTALLAWERTTFEIPMVQIPGTFTWVGAVATSFPPIFFSIGSVDVFPGPVLGGLVADCR
ncbi:MAG: LysM domain-containing protein [Firmicutes bacterium]|jgi:LysM repeat protein|nr:LysM domain-containing protein [Bacillota bacterium]